MTQTPNPPAGWYPQDNQERWWDGTGWSDNFRPLGSDQTPQPGYQQPPNNSLPAYSRNASAWRMARRNQRPWYIDPVPSYYGYDGDRHYFGRPGFYGGRYNGGSFGPCWTRTPIGPIWNCG